MKRTLKEKRKLRIIITIDDNQIRTLTTYKRFRKRLIAENLENYIYDRKRRNYQETLREAPEAYQEEAQEEHYQVPAIRTRYQVAYNYVNRDADGSGLIFISIRAITINPDYGERALQIAVEEQVNLIEAQIGIKLSEYKEYYMGLEHRELANSEDTILNDGKVYIEIFYNGEVQSTYAY